MTSGATVEAAYRKRCGRIAGFMMTALMTPSAAGSTPIRGIRRPDEAIRAAIIPSTNSGSRTIGSMYRNQYSGKEEPSGLTTSAQNNGNDQTTAIAVAAPISSPRGDSRSTLGSSTGKRK
ncbi:hypothetical protein Srufu_001050 [Streptomyces libani subsp. rufus]|nr:hypothetical protein Srufu_001050 [Streptomyces libani subsp. rufus]